MPQTQRRAETAARAAAEVAIVQAEKRARVTKEEYELSTKRLDEQLALAKVCTCLKSPYPRRQTRAVVR